MMNPGPILESKGMRVILQKKSRKKDKKRLKKGKKEQNI